MKCKYVNNYGIGGSTIAIVDEENTSSHTPLVTRYTQMAHADIIAVMCGVNDRDLDVELGDENSTDITTFYGALDLLVRGIKSKYNTSYIFFMTPLPTTWDGNDLGYTLDDYCDAIKVVCAKYEIDVLDTHNELKFDFDTDTTDGEHLTSDAYKNIMAPFIANYLKNNNDVLQLYKYLYENNQLETYIGNDIFELDENMTDKQYEKNYVIVDLKGHKNTILYNVTECEKIVVVIPPVYNSRINSYAIFGFNSNETYYYKNFSRLVDGVDCTITYNKNGSITYEFTTYIDSFINIGFQINSYYMTCEIYKF